MVIPEEFICVVCSKPCKGGFEVSDRIREDGVFQIIIADTKTPGRNFNVCDSCNDVVHFACSKYPDTGYCDKCLPSIYRDKETGFVGIIGDILDQ